MSPAPTETLQTQFWEALKANDLSKAWQLLSMETSGTVDVTTCLPISLFTPLHLAAMHSDVTLSMLLYMKGANLNAADAQGQTPLHKAAQSGSYQLVCFLVRAGADAQIRDLVGKTPREYALEEGHQDPAQLLTIAEQNPLLARKMAALNPSRASPADPRSQKLATQISKLKEELNTIETQAWDLRALPEPQRTTLQRKSLKKLESTLRKRRGELQKLQDSLSEGKSKRSWAFFSF